ncbi:MAG: protein kinase [Gemmatimonadota bacterium]|nr:protein kinase [Gemmatimonadota bacterium]
MNDAIARLTAALAGRYRIERELGGGGMSRVFLAEELALGRQVVVKVIAPELVEGLSAERFAREVKLAARLQQANIVPVLTAGDADGLPYYTMPFVRGESLRARLASGAPMAVGEAVGILRDVARALAYAHSEGIVHRDIKPENVLLSGGAAVVTDFGIAKAISASRTEDGAKAATLTQAGGSVGTPAYMAPEQAAGDQVDHRADLYAWGVLAYELLTGAHPFSHHTSIQRLIAAHLTETAASPREKNPAVPAPLAALVQRCLEKEPGRRPASAGEILAELESVATPAPVTVGRAGKRQALAVAALMVVLLLVAGLWSLRHYAGRPASGASGDKSLVVLPFESVGGDTANRYFAEGIADELSTALARLPGLRLAGRAAAARLQAADAGPREIGTALQVGAVLDGTVRRAGERIRVSAELASTADGRVLWKETYERELKDVFAVQDDITRAIVAALKVQFGGGELPGTSSRQGTSDLAAYDLYLRGLQGYRQRGAGLLPAERYLGKAIERDSGFVRAYATLVSVLLVQPYFLGVRMGAVLPRARVAAERAVALGPELPEAHLAMGHVHIEAFEWPAAEAELRRALAIDPNLAEAAYRLGFLYLTMARLEDALPALERARALDPYYAIAAAYYGWALALSGRSEEAMAEAHRTVELDSTSEAVRNIVAATYLEAGRLDEARGWAQRMARLTSNPRRLGFFASVLGATGARDEAAAIVRRLEALPPGTWGVNGALAYGYLGLGDTARALSAMEKAAAGDGEVLFSQLPGTGLYDPVRSSARFAAILRRYNLDVERVTAAGAGRSR